MTTYVPGYYQNFSCIGAQCRHNCCIGWEIDIDAQTFEAYQKMNGEFGQRLRANISGTEAVPHFVLNERERCPFLNEQNLCEIILNLGKDRLCCICRDHPRFRNFFSSLIEEGLGLCCEEAARLILTDKSKFILKKQGADIETPTCLPEEKEFFHFRQNLIEQLQDRSLSFSVRLYNILKQSDTMLPEKSPEQWAGILLGLEQMDPEWKKWLEALKKLPQFSFADIHDACLTLALEQLAVYFLFRHLADGLYDGRIRERIAFSVFSVLMIYHLYLSQIGPGAQFQFSVLAETARRYSAEIEYSDENLEALFALFRQ